MSLKGIISISGQSGLFKVLTQTKSGFIVESLIDKRRVPVSSNHQISMLEDISIFTITDDIPLKDVFKRIKETENEHPVIPAKSDGPKLKEYFKKVLPDFDEERVYTSDIKKVINWYSFVKDLLEDEDPQDSDTAPQSESGENSEQSDSDADIQSDDKTKGE
jgi:hypothetical protein